MSPDTEGLGLSFRNAVLAVVLLLTVRLGAGLARGLLDGDYLVGIVGMVLVLVPIGWLLAVIRRAEF